MLPSCVMKTNIVSNRTKAVLLDSVDDILTLPRPIVGMAMEVAAGKMIARHQHIRSQLLYASSGVMTVVTDFGIWIVPPLRAVWIPAYTDHQIHAAGPVSMRTLYIQPQIVTGLPEKCCVVAVTPLLRELLLHVVDLPLQNELNAAE